MFGPLVLLSGFFFLFSSWALGSPTADTAFLSRIGVGLLAVGIVIEAVRFVRRSR